MKKTLPLLLLLLLSCTSHDRYTMICSKIDFRDFGTPPAKYRSAPFYSLNDLLDSAELDRQITAFKKGGYGGVYLHSRTGLLTTYLGSDWWKAMDASVKACERNNIYAWFYDEDKWPSGFAGGLVPLRSTDYHARCLMRLMKSRPLPEGAKLLASDSSYNYIEYKARTGSGWFNGTCYVDLLNPATVDEFIKESYLPYRDRYRSLFGKTALGIFTDEPQVMPVTDDIEHDGVQPYSPVLADRFRKENGYELNEVIPALFDTLPGYEKIRTAYYTTLSRQLEASFSARIGDYCAENNMIFTGHYNGEDGLTSVRNNLGNLMIQSRHMQQPGLDHLGLHIDGALYAVRNISSVANQYGIGRRLSEAYGISGQNMNFEDRAWIAAWHTLNGINHLCPHLALYSMKGTRKRDYPPSLSSQQPYWDYNSLLEDYTARLCQVAATGRYAAEFLVVNPLESNYIEGGTNMKGWDRRSSGMLQLLQVLMENHRDFDLGDEQVMAEAGKVKQRTVIVGLQEYKAVILPDMLTIRSTTVDMLRQFSAAGGKVLALGMPAYVDGTRDRQKLSELEALITRTDPASLARIMNEALEPEVTVSGKGSEAVWISHRMAEGKHILQLTNTSRMDRARCIVRFRDRVSDLVLLDPASGKGFELKGSEDIELSLDRAASLVLAERRAVNGFVSSGVYAPATEGRQVLTLSGKWTGRRQDPNAITLDFARYSVDGGLTFSKAEPVIGIHERLSASGYTGPLVLEFGFTSRIRPAELALVMEQPGMYSGIAMNGSEISFDQPGFYRDHSFRSVPVTDMVVEGPNRITLKLNYKAPVPDSRDQFARYGTEIESIYLTGAFAVAADTSATASEPSQRNARGVLPPRPVHHFSSFSLTAEESEFEGDLVPAGYPFYAGGFILEKSFDISLVKGQRYFLEFPETEAVVVSVSLNGTSLPPVAWSPWEAELTGALREGSNTLTVTVINSLRNLLGPHHNAEGELIAVSPESFGGGSTWTTGRKGENNWYDLRLEGQDKTNIWRDDYCMIPFGFLEAPVITMRE